MIGRTEYTRWLDSRIRVIRKPSLSPMFSSSSDSSLCSWDHWSMGSGVIVCHWTFILVCVDGFLRKTTLFRNVLGRGFWWHWRGRRLNFPFFDVLHKVVVFILDIIFKFLPTLYWCISLLRSLSLLSPATAALSELKNLLLSSRSLTLNNSS